jgi:hypothetical protein
LGLAYLLSAGTARICENNCGNPLEALALYGGLALACCGLGFVIRARDHRRHLP